METDLSTIVSIHWTVPIVPNGETAELPNYVLHKALEALQMEDLKPVAPKCYIGQSISADRIRNRLPSGASTENPLPRPGTTSTVRCVWLQ